jgi:hypothetical protein
MYINAEQGICSGIVYLGFLLCWASPRSRNPHQCYIFPSQNLPVCPKAFKPGRCCTGIAEGSHGGTEKNGETEELR